MISPLKTVLTQQWYTPAVVEVRVCQQQVIDLSRIKTEVLGIFFFQFATTLIQTAIDQDAVASTFDQVAGTGHVTVCAVKGNLHFINLSFFQ